MGVTQIGVDASRLKRLQFDVSDSEVRELDRLMTKCGLLTRKDMFNNALTLLRWAAREIENDRDIASVDDKTEQYFILNMPIFDALRRHAREYESHSDPVVPLPASGSRKRQKTG